LGTITTLTNSGAISGGEGGFGGQAGVGGVGIANGHMIISLMNSGTINGSVGVSNLGTIEAFNNLAGGVISGTRYGLYNPGTIVSYTNNGTIIGVLGAPTKSGAIDKPAFAIFSTGSIGPIINTGQIIGNVEIEQAKVVVSGGAGKTFGVFKGGTISIVGGDLGFRGTTELVDNIIVHDGSGTVTNEGVLRLATPESIDGNFIQTGLGVLDFTLSGDVFGQYGSLAVTKVATLDSELALDPIDGFRLAAGDRFDLMTFGDDPGSFTGVSLGGVACSATLSRVWNCGAAGFNLDVSLTVSGLDVMAAGIPEPSAWALMAMGFLGWGCAVGGELRRLDASRPGLLSGLTLSVGGGRSARKLGTPTSGATPALPQQRLQVRSPPN
jgi:hypothetical protein